jgi:hypothetical protein
MLLSVVHVSNPGVLNSPENQIACRLSRAPAFEKPVIRRSINKKANRKASPLKLLQEIISVGLFYRLPQSHLQRCKLSDKPILLSKSKPERMLRPSSL